MSKIIFNSNYVEIIMNENRKSVEFIVNDYNSTSSTAQNRLTILSKDLSLTSDIINFLCSSVKRAMQFDPTFTQVGTIGIKSTNSILNEFQDSIPTFTGTVKYKNKYSNLQVVLVNGQLHGDYNKIFYGDRHYHIENGFLVKNTPCIFNNRAHVIINVDIPIFMKDVVGRLLPNHIKERLSNGMNPYLINKNEKKEFISPYSGDMAVNKYFFHLWCWEHNMDNLDIESFHMYSLCGEHIRYNKLELLW